jgi:hypothetical protein
MSNGLRRLGALLGMLGALFGLPEQKLVRVGQH